MSAHVAAVPHVAGLTVVIDTRQLSSAFATTTGPVPDSGTFCIVSSPDERTAVTVWPLPELSIFTSTSVPDAHPQPDGTANVQESETATEHRKTTTVP